MASEIKLNITITDGGGAVLGKIEQGLDGVADKSDKTKAKLAGVGSVLEGIGAGIGMKVWDTLSAGVSGAISAIPNLTAHLLDTAGALTDLSARSGFGADALQAFSIAGSMAGVSAEEITGGMLKLQKGMSEGSAETTAALKAIGLSFGELKTMSPEKQLQTVIERLHGVEDPTLRSAAAMALLGRGGAALVPLGDGLAATMDRAKALGAVMSNELIKAADDMGDRVGFLGKIWEGLGNNLVSVIATSQPLQNLIEGITDIVGSMSVYVRDNQAALQNLVDQGVFMLVDGLYVLLDAFDVAIDVWNVASDVLSTLGQFCTLLWEEALLPLADMVATLTDGFVDLRTGTSNLSLVVDVLKVAWTALKFTAAELGLAVMNVVMAYARLSGDDAMIASTQANIDALKQYQFEQEETAKKIIAGEEVKNTDAHATDGLRVKLDALKAKVHETAQAHDDGKKAAAGHAGSLGEDKKAAEALEKAHEKLVEALKKVSTETGDFGVKLSAAKGWLDPLEQKFGEIDVKAKDLATTMKAGAKTKTELDAAMGKVDDWTRIQKELAATEEKHRLLGDSTEDLKGQFEYLHKTITETGASEDFNRAQLQSLITTLTDMEQQGVDTADDVAILEGKLEALGFTSKEYDEREAERSKNRHDEKVREKQDLEDFQDALSKAMSHFGEMADVLKSVGVASDNTFVKMLDGMQKASDAGAKFRDAWKNHDWVGAAVAGAESIVAVYQAATDGGTKKDRVLGGAAAGASAGGQIGSVFGPKGAAIGAVIGAEMGVAIGIFAGDPGWKRAADFVGETFGVSITKEMGKQIEDLGKKLNIKAQDASLLMLGDFAKLGGVEVRSYSDQVQQLLTYVKDGTVPAKEGLEALGGQFATMRTEAQSAGRVGDAAMVSVIQRSRELGLEIPGVKEAVIGSLASAVEGMGKFTEMFTTFDGEMGRMGVNSATIFMGTFSAVMREKGIVAAVSEMGDSFDPLFAKLKETGDTAALALLAPFESMHAAMGDQVLGPMISAADGLRMVMVGMADAGYLDSNMFVAMEQTSFDLFNSMTQGGMSTADAIHVMAPEIQAAVSAAEQMHQPLDSNMQNLKNIAEQNGITFKTDPMLRMVTALEAIAKVLGADLPAAAGTGAAALSQLGSSGVDAADATAGTWSDTGGVIASSLEDASGQGSSTLGSLASAAGDASSSTADVWAAAAASIASEMGSQMPVAQDAIVGMANEAESALAAAAAAAGSITGMLNGIPRQVEVAVNITETTNSSSGSNSGVVPIPEAATGAIVAPRSGGSLYNVGEAGRSELIAPIGALADRIGEAAARAAGAGGGQNIYILVDPRTAQTQEITQAEYLKLQTMMASGRIQVPSRSVKNG